MVIVLSSDVPSKPGRPEATEQTDDSITLTWTPPVSDGDCRVLHYTLEKREVRGPRWMRVHKTMVEAPPYTVKNLMEGSTYQYRVSATNVIGDGDMSEMSKPVTCVQGELLINLMLV